MRCATCASWWINYPGFRMWWITHPDYLSWQIDANKGLELCDSYERSFVLSEELHMEGDPRSRLTLFLENWARCDAPWQWRSRIAGALRDALRYVSLVDVLGSEGRGWFNGLPDEITIYRGCELGRERGLSWTTDIKVALEFAQGKRCINRAPTLMTATIPKQHVFGVFTSRDESEIAVDPRRLRRLANTRLMYRR